MFYQLETTCLWSRQILIFPTYIFLLSSQQCNLLLLWYFHSSQRITRQSFSSIARDHQTEAQLIMSAPPHSCHLFPFYIVPALTQHLLHWHESVYRIPIPTSELWTEKFINGFCGNTTLTSRQAQPQHKIEVPQVNQFCFFTCFLLLKQVSAILVLKFLLMVSEVLLACSFGKLNSVSSHPTFSFSIYLQQ